MPSPMNWTGMEPGQWVRSWNLNFLRFFSQVQEFQSQDSKVVYGACIILRGWDVL